MNNIYEVISTNLDCNDGYFTNVLFTKLSDAIEYARKELSTKHPNNVVEDINGELNEYGGKSLNYSVSHKRPAIYYHSHYGDYRCVYFIRERSIN